MAVVGTWLCVIHIGTLSRKSKATFMSRCVASVWALPRAANNSDAAKVVNNRGARVQDDMSGRPVVEKGKAVSFHSTREDQLGFGAPASERPHQ